MNSPEAGRLMELRSYHGADCAKAIQFYWPRVTPNEAETLAAEMNDIDWVKFGDRKGYEQAKWLAERLGF